MKIMNSTIEKFTREAIKCALNKCSEPEILIFKRMYSHKNLSLTIDQVVNNMPIEKLDWALTQCEETLNKKQHV